MRPLLILLSVVFLPGCAELAYYTHAAGGQLQVMSAREPIEDVIANPATDNRTRQQLELIQRARQFAITELALPDSDTFRDYADLKRPWVLWNVYATPELSLHLKQWCYPFIGCHGYRIYFDENYAQQVASGLRQQGMDVYIARSPAYSTQGWFDDPVYNPMLHYDDITLVGILFHELAHERLYIINDSEMNESFATLVQNEGVRRWLQAKGDSPAYIAYKRDNDREQAFVEMILAYRAKLEILYESSASDDEKRAGKQAILAGLQGRYAALKKEWGNYQGYDHWFDKPLNNARLAPIATYNGYLKTFETILARQNGNLASFYEEIEKLSTMTTTQRRQYLQQYHQQ